MEFGKSMSHGDEREPGELRRKGSHQGHEREKVRSGLKKMK